MAYTFNNIRVVVASFALLLCSQGHAGQEVKEHHKHQKDKDAAASPATPATAAAPTTTGACACWYMTLHGGDTDTILQFDASGKPLGTVLGPTPDSIGKVHGLRGMLRLADGTLLVIAAWNQNTQVLHFGARASDGSRPFLSVFAKQDATNPLMIHPYCLAQAADGSIYASNQDSNTITRYAAPGSANAGAPIDCAGNPSSGEHAGMIVPSNKIDANGLNQVRGIAFGPDGLLYVADRGNGQVSRWNMQTCAKVDTLLRKKDADKTPIQLLFSADGTKLYISDNKENKVFCMLLADKTVTTFIGTDAGIDASSALAIDGPWLYVGSRKARAILRFALSDGTADSAPFISNLADNPEFFVRNR